MDNDLRLQVLRAAVRDRAFLKAVSHDIDAKHFEEREERLIVQAAVDFYKTYEEPIGALLASEVERPAKKLGEDARKRLFSIIRKINSGDMPLVSAKALIDRVKSLRKDAFYADAIDTILDAQEKNELNPGVLAEIVEKAQHDLARNEITSVEYFSDDELEKRIKQRDQSEEMGYPMLLIAPLDAKIRLIGRRMLGMWMAPPGGGKGLAFIHTAIAYSTQGWKVLYVSLEDPQKLVEARLDSAFTRVPLKRLRAIPEKVKLRFEKYKKRIKGRIRLVDGTDGEWTVSMIERQWEIEKQNGFTADVILVDYDDEVACEKQFKGESARRFEFAEIYRAFRRLARRTDTIVWTAAQPVKAAANKKIITGVDAAEDYSKIRKVFLCLTIGTDQEDENIKFVYVAKSRVDRSHFGVEIISDFSRALLYDEEATEQHRREKGWKT